MKGEIEPMQQMVRIVVGRSPSMSRRLMHLEEMTAFLRKHAHGALTRVEGDFFPGSINCWPAS